MTAIAKMAAYHRALDAWNPMRLEPHPLPPGYEVSKEAMRELQAAGWALLPDALYPKGGYRDFSHYCEMQRAGGSPPRWMDPFTGERVHFGAAIRIQNEREQMPL